jgi:hypothetical protein
MISHFHIFGCPVVARKLTAGTNTSGKQTERGIRGIFVSLDDNKKGYKFFAPGTRQLHISGDMIFDESFTTAIATT